LGKKFSKKKKYSNRHYRLKFKGEFPPYHVFISAIEMLHDIALYKFNIHIHIHISYDISSQWSGTELIILQKCNINPVEAKRSKRLGLKRASISVI